MESQNCYLTVQFQISYVYVKNITNVNIIF